MIAPVRLPAAALVWAGANALACTLTDVRVGARVAVLHDPAVEAVVAAVAKAHPRHALERVAVHGTATLDAAREAAGRLRERRPAAVLAIGGGTAIDVAKLAALAAGAPSVLDEIARRSRRAGYVALTTAPVRDVPLLAVPTTIGTGAEASAVVCVLDGAENRTLVHAAGLRPDVAILDPLATRTLPARLVREGALEALLRVAGPEIVAPSTLPMATTEARALIRGLANVLEACGERPGDDVRLLLAQLSGASHRGWALSGRGPYPWPLWFVANELATVISTTKMEATMLLLGPWLQRVRDGDVRWGDHDRLKGVWEEIAGAPLPADCAGAGSVLLARWGLLPRLAGVHPGAGEATAERAVARWGGALPMLGRFSGEEIAALASEALAGPAGPRRVAA